MLSGMKLSVQIGNTKLYYHKEGYYCTEPEIEGYLGIFTQIIRSKDRDRIINDIKNKREYKNVRLLSKSIDWSKGSWCQINEYQSGKYIYGVCNFYDQLSGTDEKLPLDKITSAVAYRIDCSKESFEILFRHQDICAVLCTENYVIYEEDNKLIKEDHITGDKENLLDLKDVDSECIKLQFQILQVSNRDQLFGFYWDQKDCIRVY